MCGRYVSPDEAAIEHEFKREDDQCAKGLIDRPAPKNNDAKLIGPA